MAGTTSISDLCEVYMLFSMERHAGTLAYSLAWGSVLIGIWATLSWCEPRECKLGSLRTGCLQWPIDSPPLRTLSDLHPRRSGWPPSTPAKPRQVPRQVANNSAFYNSSRKGPLLGKSFLFDNLIVQTNHLRDTGHSSPRAKQRQGLFLVSSGPRSFRPHSIFRSSAQ